MPGLSVIIPAYNEEKRLPQTLSSVYEYLIGQGESFEIIVVDDGSKDATKQIVEDFARHYEGIRLIASSPNRGKGHAVRVGMLAAQGDLLLLNDADGSSPIEELSKLKLAIVQGADVAIGSRAKPGGVVKTLAYRKYIGNTFNTIVQSLLLPGIQDTQCGFKLFKHKAAQDVFSTSRLNGYGFDVEILYIAKLHGYTMTEVAIDWTNAEGSKVNVFLDSPKMFFEVLKVVVSGWLGRYEKASSKKEDVPSIMRR